MNKPTYSTALSSTLHREAIQHLLREDGHEDLCFGLWYPSGGHTRTTALVHKLVLPMDDERVVHGNVAFQPQYFERVLSEAVQANAGIAFLHSHLGPGWQGMSQDDVRAEEGIAGAVKGATGFPLLGLTLGTDGAWSARLWIKSGPRSYDRRWCSNVRVVGEQLSVTYAEKLMPRPGYREFLSRTISAWGEEVQYDLARLRIGVVGAGSVGSMVAESLARTGVRRLTLIDFDRVEAVNLDRLLHATRLDAALHRPKVKVLGRAIRKSATSESFVVDESVKSVVEEDGFRDALDCDLIFSCVDSPWARHVLNFIAYAHLIPVVDGGILVRATKRRKLKSADWRAHIASPERRCLVCVGQYDIGLVQAEREGYFNNARYIEGLPQDHFLLRSENVSAFSMNVAGLQLLQMLMMVVAPLGVANLGQYSYHLVPGIFEEPNFEGCKTECPFPRILARGDKTGLLVTGLDHRANATRASAQDFDRKMGWRLRTYRYLSGVMEGMLDRVEKFILKGGEETMATNPPSGDGHRNGAVRDRSQVHNPKNDRWVKRDDQTGRFVDQKADPKPFKGVRREK
ncbi:MAG: ThiF family adenylyltransferase [Acidobacteriia bacterium]|nr:ThiF family adenylyltransferase [Terriglobia bacterium]